MQGELFNPADVSPTPGERRRARAAEREAEREKRSQTHQLKLWRKSEDLRRRSAGRHPAECCLGWYPADSRWTRCHKCGKLLDYTSPTP